MLILREPARSNPGPPEWFTGEVWYDELVLAPAPARVRLLNVHFAPGARSWWHTHPVGQAIHVTQGVALVQREGGPVERVRTGESVWFEPGEIHWQGAAAECQMTHVSVQESDEDGTTAVWLRPVTDDEYAAA